MAPLLQYRGRWFALGLALGILVTLGAQRLYAREGFFKASWDMVLGQPITPTKVLILVTAVLVFAALPLAIADLRSDRRFRRMERALREAQPADEVHPYEGPEGEGLRFEGPEGARLLLRPPGGFGQPRIVEVAPPPEVADDEGEPAAQAVTS